MKAGWIVAQFLDHEPVNCASLTDTFIESFSKLLILNANSVNIKSLSGTKSYRDIRETDPLFATERKKLLVDDKLQLSCQTSTSLKHYIKHLTNTKKIELWKTVRITSFQKPKLFCFCAALFVALYIFFWTGLSSCFYVLLSLMAAPTVHILSNFVTQLLYMGVKRHCQRYMWKT